MNILSWNVNGLRAVHKKGNFAWLLEHSPDVFCLQETKSEKEQLPDDVRSPPGYHSYFDSSKLRKGYSAVAIYSKIKPDKVDVGMGMPEFDQEGRLLAAHFKEFVLVTVYFPNGGQGPERLAFKLKFYDAFLAWVDRLHKAGKPVIFCGDVNTAHEAIDLARPKENEDVTGFLRIERDWLDKVVKHGYVDTFRHFQPAATGAYTYWDMKTFARKRNVGWRIDYHFVTQNLMPQVKDATIHMDVEGSDHCPIGMELKV